MRELNYLTAACIAVLVAAALVIWLQNDRHSAADHRGAAIPDASRWQILSAEAEPFCCASARDLVRSLIRGMLCNTPPPISARDRKYDWLDEDRCRVSAVKVKRNTKLTKKRKHTKKKPCKAVQNCTGLALALLSLGELPLLGELGVPILLFRTPLQPVVTPPRAPGEALRDRP